ncbi:MAG: hypothetical protein C3F06_13480 [Candidatus Methanoperedenaceae archaeon]|nr:MAG: hypothetical protein C3F06_13480 [Candidatus Methanoperedenaceae archaeon]
MQLITEIILCYILFYSRLLDRLLRYLWTIKITIQKINAPISAPFQSSSLLCKKYFRIINITKYVNDAEEAV